MVRAVLVLGLLAACGDPRPEIADADPSADAAVDAAVDVATDAIDASTDAMGIALSPPSNGFGTLAVGSTSAYVTFTVVNPASHPSGALAPALTGASGDFLIANDTCTGTLVPAQSACTLSVAFKPTAVGARAAMLQVTDPSSGTQVASSLTGTGIAELTISPAFVDTGTVCIGSTGSYYSATVTNHGAMPTAALAVSLVGAQAGEFTIASDSCNGAIIPAQGTCSFSVALRPTSVGARAGSVRIMDGATSAEVSAVLTGVGVTGCGGLMITPSSYDFGTVNVGDTAFAHQFTLTNVGGSTTGTLSTATGGPNVGEFLKMADNCNGQTLGPGAACTLFISFEPGAAGPRSARISAVATPGGIANGDLSGTGQ